MGNKTDAAFQTAAIWAVMIGSAVLGKIDLMAGESGTNAFFTGIIVGTILVLGILGGCQSFLVNLKTQMGAGRGGMIDTFIIRYINHIIIRGNGIGIPFCSLVTTPEMYSGITGYSNGGQGKRGIRNTVGNHFA